MTTKPTLLIVMDGVGMPCGKGESAVLDSNTQGLQALARAYPSTVLYASEEYVGLPKGQTGTSEVGHMTIGAGRRIDQMLVRINKNISSGEFFNNKTLLSAIDYARDNHKKIHLLGITSDGGIHSHIDHLFAIMQLLARENMPFYVHFVADGRDTLPRSAKEYIRQVLDYIGELKIGSLATVVGRYYAFDRDKNYDRNKLAYDLWTRGIGKACTNVYDSIDSAYTNGESDEFLTPIVVDKGGLMETGDVVVSYNFRTDRERQTADVLLDNDLDFSINLSPYLVTMTLYDSDLAKKTYVIFDEDKPRNILSEVLSSHKIKQLKVAETEKFAHLTFFFNSGRLQPFDDEDRVLIPSKKMASYALCPEMSAREITDTVLGKMNEYDFVAVNFANGDMVGHSGELEPTKIAVKVVNDCVLELVDAFVKVGGQGIVTSDHGNADIMVYDNGEKCTSHTLSRVPCIVFGEEYKGKKLIEGLDLSSVAPTLLKMMNIPIPQDMTGRVLFE